MWLIPNPAGVDKRLPFGFVDELNVGSYGLGLEFSVVSYGKPRVLFCFFNLHYKDEMTHPGWKATQIKQGLHVVWNYFE